MSTYFYFIHSQRNVPGLKVQYDYHSCYIHIVHWPKILYLPSPLVSAQPSLLSPLQKDCTHTPFTNHFLIKAANCMDRLYLQESSGVYISKGDCAVAEAITNKLSPPEDLPTSSASVSSFSSGLLLRQCNTLQSDLPYYGNDQSFVYLPRGGSERKTLAKYLSCVMKEDQRRLEVGGNNGVFKERAGDGWVEEKHRSLTSIALQQWNKAKTVGRDY